MTIFGRVLCPLQPSCLAPLHAARALLLSSFPLAVYPHFFCFLPLLLLLLHHKNRTLFIPLLVSFVAPSAPYHSLPLLSSPAHPVTALFCLFSPNPLLPLIHLLPASPLFTASFVLSLVITSCVPPFCLILPQQEAVHIQVYSTGCVQGARVCWPLAYSGSIPVFLISPAARSTRVCKFINLRTSSHMGTNTFVTYESVRVLSLHLHTHTHVFVNSGALAHSLNLCERVNTHAHTYSIHLLAAGLIAWKMNTKCRAKWLAGITLAVCSSPPALCRHETGAPPYLSPYSDILGLHSLVRRHTVIVGFFY